MSCAEGTGYQCAGTTAIKTDNNVVLTRSGVQVFGISTSDLAVAPGTPEATAPRGFALPSILTTPVNGVADIRLAKDATTNAVTRAGLLLDDFGLSWDGKVKRPLIVDTFETSQGRIVLTSNGALPDTPAALPAATDTAFWDFTTKGTLATQANYANNYYFSRTSPIQCAQDAPPDCAQRVPTLIDNNLGGDWRSTERFGVLPDFAAVGRFHEDGDIHAPNVPFPGSKGFRSLSNRAYQHVNLGTWTSQDTVFLADWNAELRNEHNKKRHGFVAFGNVTSPAAVPTDLTNVVYVGKVYGSIGQHGDVAGSKDDPDTFVGNARVTVNFATGEAQIEILETVTFDAAETPVPAALFTTTATRGTVSVNGTNTPATNYFTGSVSNATTGMSGGLSGRYFGPTANEIGGTFQLSNATARTAIIGGFIGRRQ